uniref:Ig-like domain-containing protein n=1 Tax=Seriola lalandi dorsalis TaxID=1841481 RepID=A0A3B4XBF6_SERLL
MDIIKHGLVSLLLFLLWIKGSSLSDQVHQSPVDIYWKSGEEATIKCSHSIQSYDRILWYKQLKNRQLQFLGYMVANTGKPEDGVKVKIGGSANQGETSTLTIEGLSENNSAVYFCAASYHSDTHHCSSVQKPAQTVFISVLQLRVP